MSNWRGSEDNQNVKNENSNQPKITGFKPAEGSPTGGEPDDPFLAGFNSI